MKQYNFDSDISISSAESILKTVFNYESVVHFGACETHVLDFWHDVSISGGSICVQRRDKKDLNDNDIKHCEYLRLKLEIKSKPSPEIKSQ